MLYRGLRILPNWEIAAGSEWDMSLMSLGCRDDAIAWLLRIAGMQSGRDGEVTVRDRANTICQQIALVVVRAQTTFLNLNMRLVICIKDMKSQSYPNL